ncbi:MAG: TRAP transporter fused permease subunit [Rhizobiales bacterium]|nr:TRAP transporter fused permease subunit [Hyphomicrobiales bacterium]
MPVVDWLKRGLLAAITILSVLWVFDVPLKLGFGGIIQEQFYLLITGLVTGASLLHVPLRRQVTWIDVALALAAVACWGWAAWNVDEWLIESTERGPERWLPGLLGILLLMLALYKNVGLAIAVTIGAIGVYGFVGHWFPGIFEGQYTEPRRLIMYLYADSNGVPGLVFGVAVTLVLCFIAFSKALSAAGAGSFFDRLAMSLLGNHRGGPAKVAVLSSGLFGMISGSAVANVTSSGIITIPLMIRSGFKPAMAAGIEANASHAGQITPPVMGATAFLIAEFLQIPYRDVVFAAAFPAFIFYAALFIQIDAHAARYGLVGLPRSELPRLGRALAEGWVFIIPIAVLIYFMFWEGTKVEKAAIYATVLMIVLGGLMRRDFRWGGLLEAITVGVGQEMIPILLVSAAAGIVIGVLNISGLAFTITLLLTTVAEHAGILAMLLMTAAIALVLGMGLPTTAVYVLLSVVLAPALVKMGIAPLAAHMFIFYLGMMSFLTPPVAMSSYTAAAIANADLWETSVDAIRTGASGYLLPFIFALNPALILVGSPLEVLFAVMTVLLSAAFLSWAAESSLGAIPLTTPERIVSLIFAFSTGSSTLVFGSGSLANLAVLIAGGLIIAAFCKLSSGRMRVAVQT